MNKVILFLLALFGTQLIYASTFEWEIQITDPEFELSYKKLSDEGYQPYMKKTSWRCFVTPEERKRDRSIRKMRCNYSIKKTGKVTTVLSCSNEKTYDEVTFELFDEKKNLTFSVMLLCRKK